MTRLEFTHNLSKLLLRMTNEGEYPILDYIKRSSEEQNRLFLAGLSKKDGYKKLSAHQIGKAADIYFIDITDKDNDGVTQELTDPIKGHEYWHKIWESMGGRPMISWDKGHYEG